MDDKSLVSYREDRMICMSWVTNDQVLSSRGVGSNKCKIGPHRAVHDHMTSFWDLTVKIKPALVEEPNLPYGAHAAERELSSAAVSLD